MCLTLKCIPTASVFLLLFFFPDLFPAPSWSSFLEQNILKKEPEKKCLLEFKNKRRSRTKCTYCIHWCMSLHNVWAVICSGMTWKSLFGQMITGLPVSIKTQDSDFTWERSLSNVAEIVLRISCAGKKEDTFHTLYHYHYSCLTYGTRIFFPFFS